MIKKKWDKIKNVLKQKKYSIYMLSFKVCSLFKKNNLHGLFRLKVPIRFRFFNRFCRTERELELGSNFFNVKNR